MIIFWLAVACFASTLLGGIITLRFQRSLPLFFAFAAGAIISVALLDILPECLELAAANNITVRTVMLIVVAAFFVYSLLERFLATHSLETESHEHTMGMIGAGSLVAHSFFDGCAIGAAFRINVNVGMLVALAIVMHDTTDGLNTVVLMLKDNHTRRNAFYFLVADAIAPVIGVALATVIRISPTALTFILAIFVGEFISVGAVTLLPEARKSESNSIVVAIGWGITIIAVLTSFI